MNEQQIRQLAAECGALEYWVGNTITVDFGLPQLLNFVSKLYLHQTFRVAATTGEKEADQPC